VRRDWRRTNEKALLGKTKEASYWIGFLLGGPYTYEIRPPGESILYVSLDDTFNDYIVALARFLSLPNRGVKVSKYGSTIRVKSGRIVRFLDTARIERIHSKVCFWRGLLERTAKISSNGEVMIVSMPQRFLGPFSTLLELSEMTKGNSEIERLTDKEVVVSLRQPLHEWLESFAMNGC
jgi:hypothetical protein